MKTIQTSQKIAQFLNSKKFRQSPKEIIDSVYEIVDKFNSIEEIKEFLGWKN